MVKCGHSEEGSCPDCQLQFLNLLPELVRYHHDPSIKKAPLVLGSGCTCSSQIGWGPIEECRLPLLLCTEFGRVDEKSKDSRNIHEAIRISIDLLNALAGRTLFVFFGDKPSQQSFEDHPQKSNIVVIMGTDLKIAHGQTHMYHDPTTGRSTLPHRPPTAGSSYVRKLQTALGRERVAIRMELRRKPKLKSPQRLREYVSTLTHELLHVLGFGHIIAKDEIMSVGRGGTCICSKCPWPPKLRKSPKTSLALTWLYSPVSVDVQETLGGYPIHCRSCFEIGWKFN